MSRLSLISVGLIFFGGACSDDSSIQPEADATIIEPAMGIWTQSAGDLPTPRGDYTLAYDSERARVVLFGGYYGEASPYYLADTWEWDGHAWKSLAAVGPIARSRHAMTYDPVRKRVVLFGGMGGSSKYLDDLWEFDGTAWVQKQLGGQRPSARAGHALAYDAARDRIVLFGGHDGAQVFGDTWEWNGANWEKLTPGTLPPSRAGHAMAYDAGRNKTVMFGGATRDVWEWNGTTWRNVSPDIAAEQPGPREWHAMAYHPARQKVVLFGGLKEVSSQSTMYFDDTWEWDGGTWTKRDVAMPPKRAHHELVYDAVRDRLVLLGGNCPEAATKYYVRDMWQYR